MATPRVTAAEISERITSRYAGDIKQIRSDGSRTSQWKTGQIAAIYLQMKREIEQETQKRDAAEKEEKLRLERKVFGIEGIKGDHGSLLVARRDAGDRVAGIDNPVEASALLARAASIGDETLERAIAEHAYRNRWLEVLNEFLDHHPEFESALSDLWNWRNPNLNQAFREAMQLEVAIIPEELRGMSDHAIDLAARQVGA